MLPITFAKATAVKMWKCCQIVNERKTTMTKKQAGVIAVIAFAALLRRRGDVLRKLHTR